MKVHIEAKPAFRIAGLALKNAQNENLPALWDRLFNEVPGAQLLELGSGESFGACYDTAFNPHSFTYMAGYDLADPDRATKLGLDVLDVPEAEYAIFELRGPVPDCIFEGWNYAVDNWLPQNNYRHSGTPDFEFYLEGDLNSPDYKMEIWVPIVKA